MNSKLGKTNALVLALSLSLGVSGIGLATAQTGMADSADSEQPVTDTWITTKVKGVLATTDGVKSTDISVNTANGIVTLTGNQESKAAVDTAVAAARGVEGVTRVDSSGLRVSAAAAGTANTMDHDDDDSDQPVTDTWITTKVKAELATTDGVKSLDISVTTTNGEVVLTGTQESKMAVDKAVAATKSVEGVRNVDASGLKVAAGNASDYDGKDSEQPVTDTWITTKVKAELATTDGVKSTDITVATTDGKVTLIGALDSQTVVDKAVAAARGVKGVRDVDASGLKAR